MRAYDHESRSPGILTRLYEYLVLPDMVQGRKEKRKIIMSKFTLRRIVSRWWWVKGYKP